MATSVTLDGVYGSGVRFVPIQNAARNRGHPSRRIKFLSRQNTLEPKAAGTVFRLIGAAFLPPPALRLRIIIFCFPL
jgi:hypothetical protein